MERMLNETEKTELLFLANWKAQSEAFYALESIEEEEDANNIEDFILRLVA